MARPLTETQIMADIERRITLARKRRNEAQDLERKLYWMEVEKHLEGARRAIRNATFALADTDAHTRPEFSPLPGGSYLVEHVPV